jgi:small GTP-binding protein
MPEPIRKKVCMLGSFSVGKTSLVRRFVDSTYSDKYLTTVGVNVRKKMMHVSGDEVMVMLWDIYGEDDFQKLRRSDLNGTSGYLLVADGTRRATLEKALELHERVQVALGSTPAVLVMNKFDLAADWEVTPEMEQELHGRGWEPVHSSAKTGEGVEEAFLALARAMLGQKP